ncbi:MAG: ABC transporter permease subunit [Hyphomicrobiales bacterium]|nr:ABC transporter permease subunit [Hyphomicrobiales bacterium]
MTTRASPPRERFRISQLIYDTRYRSYTIQVFALFMFAAFVGWLVNNTLQNLSNAGKDLDFGFLFSTAGYEINQRLVSYGPDSSHLRASIVGLLNTLLVALLGCVMATVIGTFVGILRLSKNWLIARLMGLYVEMFRNVPLLLWILLTMAVLTELLPSPREFRGESATASMMLNDTSAITNRGVYVPLPQFSRGLDKALDGSLGLNPNALAILFVLGAGLYVSQRIKLRADRIQSKSGERPVTWFWRTGVIVVPVLVLFFAFGFHLEYPELKGFNFIGGLRFRNSLIALWLALSLYTAAFIGEVVRSGIMAVPKGQIEGAEALGLRPARIMRSVILPQALRVIIPPVISQYLSLTKNTSLAIAVGYMDITGTLGGITMNQTGRELECVLLLMLVYLAISLTVSAGMNVYNARVNLVER